MQAKQENAAQSFDEIEAYFRPEIGLPPEEASPVDQNGTLTGPDLLEENSDPDQNAKRSNLSGLEDWSDAALLASVEADVADAQTKIAQGINAPSTATCDDADDLWLGGDYQTVAEFVDGFHEIFPELHPILGNRRSATVDGSPIVVTSGVTNAGGDQTRSGRTGTDERTERRRRGPAIPKRVAKALLKRVENDPDYRALITFREKQHLRFVSTISEAEPDAHRITSARDDFLASVALVEDYHLATLQVLAHAILRCGQYGAFACGSYWCPHCRMRFGARLLEDTQAQLRQRYGDDLERARDRLLYGTILCDIVIPTPDLDRDYGPNFAASTISRDHISLLNYLRGYQADRRSAMSALLAKRGLSLELVKDWIEVGDRDRTFYDPKNAVADAARLIALNDLIVAVREQFKSRRKRPDLESSELISWRDEGRTESYMWQLRKAQLLDRKDIITLADGFQFIDRKFRGITKTSYPERLKFKSSNTKVIRRERKKLYRLSKDLPGVSLIGVFELELVDLRHAISGDHQHSVKANTLRVLASQERKPTKYRKSEEEPSIEAQIRRAKNAHKNRLLDDARERIAANKELPEDQFPGIQYAVLLHMHVVIDLNGTPREDVEQWFNGKSGGNRRFKGQWPLPYQVMIKSLYESKPVDDSLRHISFYPFKGPVTFNYENTAPKRDEELPEGDARHYPDEALALAAWLQHSIGHESLRVAIDWPGVDREKRGPKLKREPTPKITEDELEEALSELGAELPRDPKGQTDISPMFEGEGEGVQAAPPAIASTSTESCADDAEGTAAATDRKRPDRGGEEGSVNETAHSTNDGRGGIGSNIS